MPAFTIPLARYVDQRPVYRNFQMFRGETVAVVFNLVAADVFPAVPVNVTGASVTFRVRRKGGRSRSRALTDYGWGGGFSGAGYTEFELSIGNGVVLTSPTGGVITVTIPSTATSDICHGAFDWQLAVTLSGAMSVRASGTLVIDDLIDTR